MKLGGDHKLHVAETYITKAGMRDVKDDLGRLNERIDRMRRMRQNRTTFALDEFIFKAPNINAHLD